MLPYMVKGIKDPNGTKVANQLTLKWGGYYGFIWVDSI